MAQPTNPPRTTGRSPERERPDAGPRVHKWLVLAVVAIGGFMASLNSASLIIILPTLQQDLHTQLINILWVLLSYTLASAVLLLAVGRRADLWGNKRIYLVGYAVFAVGSVLSALATDVNVLIAARFVQGVGGAMLIANASAIITHTFPRRELGRALGVSSMVYAVGTTLGPIVGGLLTDALSWRYAFWVNVPIAAVGFVLAALYLYDEAGARKAGGADGAREGFDFVGAALLAVSFSALLVFVSLGPMYGWASTEMLVALGVFALATALFLARQLAARHPLLDLRLFGNRLFTMANLSASFASMGMIAVLFLLPFYLEDVLHYSLFWSAVLLAPYPITMLIVSPISGYLSDRFGSRLLGTLGMILAAFSLLSLSTLDLRSTYDTIALRLVLLGLGMGLFQSPNNSAVMSAVAAGRRGVASAVLGTMRNLGQMLGIGIIGAVFVSFMPYDAFLQLALTGETTATGAQEVVAAFRICYLVATGFAVLGALTSLIRGKHVAHAPEHRPEPLPAARGAGTIPAAALAAAPGAGVRPSSGAYSDQSSDQSSDRAWAALGMLLAALAREARMPGADPRLLDALSASVDGAYPHEWEAGRRARAVARDLIEPLAAALLASFPGGQDGHAPRLVPLAIANGHANGHAGVPTDLRKRVRVTRRTMVDGRVVGERMAEQSVPLDADTRAIATALEARLRPPAPGDPTPGDPTPGDPTPDGDAPTIRLR